MKEYKFAKELLEVYGSEDKIKPHNIMYISAWILGISVEIMKKIQKIRM